ncbi:MAG: hypothetical protein QNK36_13045 [Colwellia sp.]|nr:hypothetical protein [Colwellia sp.]
MLTSQLEIIKQGEDYLNTLINDNNNANYCKVFLPLFISSAGAHMRHIIDHYLALIAGLPLGEVDYDVRHRNSKVELEPKLALDKLAQISCWIKSLENNDLMRALTLSTEISVHEQKVQSVPTSLARELVFAGSHAVHHYAMIAQIAQQQDMVLPSGFGIAPATATYLRKTQQHA